MDKLLQHQIGQLLLAGFPSTEVDEQARTLIEEYQVGNFILFAQNMQDARQVARLCGGLSDRAFAQNGLAPFIAADQEGGTVSRITQGAALFPGAMALGAAATEDEVRQVGKNCGAMLRAMGVNVNLAPVLDVNSEPMNPVIGIRSFGDDPQQVARLGCAMAEGMVEGGVLAVVKHYPGHGNVQTDSHLDLPTNNSDPALLEETEFLPFRRAFERGVPALMSCHIRFPRIDPQPPATLSPTILNGILRERQGFSGLVFTDCLEMEAIQKGWGVGEGAVLAVLAGCDVLCISHHLEAVKAAAEALYQAVQTGRIPRERIRQSYDRVLAAKKQMGLDVRQHIDPEAAIAAVEEPDRLALHRALSRRSVTCVSGDPELVCRAKKPLFVAPVTHAATGVEDAAHNGLSFARLAAQALGGEYLEIDREPDEAQQQAVLEQAARADVVVLGVQNARFRPGLSELIRTLSDAGHPLALVLLAGPWDIPLLPRAALLAAAYEYTALSVSSVIDALRTGRFSGHLPVRL